MHFRRLFLAAAVSLAPVNAGADDADLAARAAAQLKPLLPGYDITETDPLTLKLHKAGGQEMQINLDRIRQYCDSNPDRCDAELSDFTTRVAGLVKEGEAQANPTAQMLRVIVRTADYVNGLNQQLSAQSDQSDRLVDAPIAANLRLLCAFDTPNALRPVLDSDLKALGMTADQAMAACKANSEKELPAPLSQVKPLDPHTLGILNVGYYTSSEFAFPERWAAVNAKLGGKLIVCLPGNDVMLYGRNDGPNDVDALRTYAVQAARNSDRPISPDVYRWTKTGWEIVQ